MSSFPKVGLGLPKDELSDVQHGRIYDTVLVSLPASRGSEFSLFRDIADKDNVLTNLTTSRRLPSGQAAKIDKVEVTLTHWAGDDLQHLLRMFGSLRLRINARDILDLPLRDLWTPFKVDLEISDTDDINAKICMEGAPWDAPTVMEWREVVETADEQLLLPGPLARLNPVLRRSTTTMKPVSRPKRGATLVTVSLDGMVKRPVGR